MSVGCSATVKFIDRDSGNVYLGSTGGTLGKSGGITAEIEGKNYTGEWIYSPNGGGYTLSSGNATAYGPAGVATATGLSTNVTMSAQGDGMIHMRSTSGESVRCVFKFNGMSSTGMGQCQRNDGRAFDLTIKR